MTLYDFIGQNPILSIIFGWMTVCVIEDVLMFIRDMTGNGFEKDGEDD